MLVVKSFADNLKPQSGGAYQGWEVSPLCGYGLNVMKLLPKYHRFAVGKSNQVRKSYYCNSTFCVTVPLSVISRTR